MNNVKTIAKINRLVGLNQFPSGYNDIFSYNQEAHERWWSTFSDFDCQSYHPYPAPGTNYPAWCPAYFEYASSDKYQKKIKADVMVFDLHGCSSDHAYQFLIRYNIAGMIHPTKSDTLTNPRCRIIFLLSRAVNDSEYRDLWNRMAHELFNDIPNPAHADFRHRFDFPGAVHGESVLMHHDGVPLDVDGTRSIPSITWSEIATMSAKLAKRNSKINK